MRGGAQALSINPVRSSLDTGLKLFVMKRGAVLRRAVATLGAALNDTSGAVSFAARRTTNEGPSRPGDDCLGRTGAERRPPK